MIRPLTTKFAWCLLMNTIFISNVFCQSVLPCNSTETCFKRKNLYLDYSKFKLNKLNSDDFNISTTENTAEYFNIKGWSVVPADNSIDSTDLSVFNLTGEELEIHIKNWKLENEVPQFLIGNIQKEIKQVLGLYEWRVKFNDFFALSATTAISKPQSFQYNIIDYLGNAPKNLSMNAWNYYPIHSLDSLAGKFDKSKCKETVETINVDEKKALQLAFESDKKTYKGNQKYYQYDCKACNCSQSICFNQSLLDNYHTFSLVLTTTEAAFFMDGILISMTTLGGNDTNSICPFTIAECVEDAFVAMSSGMVQQGDEGDFSLRNDMWNYLLTGNEVKWTIDYFRKYDFIDSVMFKDYLEEYVAVKENVNLKSYKPQKLALKSSFLSDGSLVFLSENNELILTNREGVSKPMISHRTKKTIEVSGDFVVAPSDDIYFVNPSGFIDLLKRDSLGNYAIIPLSSSNNVQKVKNTVYKDLGLLDYEDGIEIVFRTKNDNIGRFFENRGRWYFIEMTSKASIGIDGDLQTGTNGKIFYRGTDGYLHGIKVKGKKRESLHINVRPLGMKTPKVDKSVSAFVITDRDEIIYKSVNDNLIYFYLNGSSYKIKDLTQKSNTKCDQVSGGLAWMADANKQQLLFFDKKKELSSFVFDKDNKTWAKGNISFSKEMDLGGGERYTPICFQSEIYFWNKKDELMSYQLMPSAVKINDENYAPYIDKTEECQALKPKANVYSFDKRLSDSKR